MDEAYKAIDVTYPHIQALSCQRVHAMCCICAQYQPPPVVLSNRMLP